MSPGIDPHMLTKNKQNIHLIINDNLNVPFMTAKMLQTFLDIRNIIFQEIYSDRFNIPILFLVSLKDKICVPQFAIKYYNRMVNSKKELVIFEDGRHEIIFDEEYQEILDRLGDWFTQVNVAPTLFSVPKYIKFNYSCFDWRYTFKVILLIVGLGYLLKKRRGALKMVWQLAGLKKGA